MANKGESDIFMMFTYDGGTLQGESTTVLQIPGKSPSPLLKGFQPGKMFEITRFELGVGVEQPAVDNFELSAFLKGLSKAVPGYKPEKPPPPKYQPKDPQAPNPQDSPVSVQPISFSRPMDRGSYLLLHHTIQKTYFTSAALVKRKSAGSAAAGEPYLRLDFTGVLLIEASWSNDEPIQENYTFHARAITMRYCPQLPDGSLGAAISGFWSMVPNAKEAT
jgi:type VI protein secretion system component Hcp